MKEKSKAGIAEGRELPRLRPPDRAALNSLSSSIIGAAIEVHRHLGPGLLESAYEECLCYELTQSNLAFRRQVAIPVKYKGLSLKCDFRLDLIVEDTVIVEVKTVDQLAPIHAAQLLTYLKATDKPLGLLINFNVPILKKGIKRLLNDRVSPEAETSTSVPSVSEPGGQDTPESLTPSLCCSPRLGVSVVNRRPH